MPPCLCMVSPAPPPALFPLAVRWVCGPCELFGQGSGFQQALQQSDVWARPGSRSPAAACSGERDGWVRVRSGVGLSVRVETKNTSSQMRQTLRRREEGRTRTKGHKGSTTSGTKDVNQSWPEAGGPLNHHTALTQTANVNPLWAPLIFVSIPSSISRKSLTFGEICLLSFLLEARREDNLVGPVTRVIPAYWSIDWYKQEAVYLT